MDFMKWLSSLDEFLYEIVSWLVFFPLTLWRALRRPFTMMDYAELQLGLPPEDRFLDAVSPPLFLTLAMLASHGVGVALGQADEIVANKHGLAALVSDDKAALILRVVVFAAFPLMMAARLVRRRGERFSRETLKGPFYAQCYPTAVFALSLSLGTTLAQVQQPAFEIAGALLVVAAFVYYLATQTRWFAARLGANRFQAFIAAMLGLLEGFGLLYVVGFLLQR